MPKGQAAVIWTPENDVKLFLTILAVQAIQVDFAAVAKAFGPNVPGSCIQTRMGALRKKAKEMGDFPFSSKGAATKRPLATASTTPAKKQRVKKTKSEIDDDDSEEDGKAFLVTPTQSVDNECVKNEPITPPSSAKKVHATKSRVSPRKAAKKDYKAIGDPYVSMENNDSNGERIFGDEKSESEDSAASDGDFRAEFVQTIPVVEI
ncbi:hypothetical protein MMC07_000906 [Pseudocyphellaria aurata]|nr:hypothetical protein [Pseudocyphellaria aurata]